MLFRSPGNVRELENVIERAVVLSSGPTLTPDLFPEQLTGMNPAARYIQSRPDASLFEIIEECERRVIIDMLERVNWNQTEAAEQFHVPLSTLNQKIKRLGIEIQRKSKDSK